MEAVGKEVHKALSQKKLNHLKKLNKKKAAVEQTFILNKTNKPINSLTSVQVFKPGDLRESVWF